MDAKMHHYTTQDRLGAAPADKAFAALDGSGVHTDALLAMLAQVQHDAQAWCYRVQAAQSTLGGAGEQAQVSAALQQTKDALQTIQYDIAAQQARLDTLLEGASAESERAGNRATGARARLTDSLRASQSEAQVATGLKAMPVLHAGPAAGSGLGSGASGQEADNVVQMPGGQREGLDGIVTLVGGMLRQASAPKVVGKQAPSREVAWEARPDSASLQRLQDQWGHYVSSESVLRQSPESMDINQLIQWVMREAYTGNSQDLRAHATRVEYYTRLKTQLREELNRAREYRSRHRTGSGDESKLDAPFDLHHISVDPDVSSEGQWSIRPPQPDGTTESLEDLDAYIKKLDNSLSTVGDDGQAAQLDLQNLSQKQAQLMNMLSNLSKAMHDTAMSIIRKIGN